MCARCRLVRFRFEEWLGFLRLSVVSWWSLCVFCFFFFSSRRRHTRFDCDWSSDVCSSDLVHADRLREGLRLIRRLTPKPIGMNVLIEQSSRLYLERMQRWVDVAIEEGVRFLDRKSVV